MWFEKTKNLRKIAGNGPSKKLFLSLISSQMSQFKKYLLYPYQRQPRLFCPVSANRMHTLPFKMPLDGFKLFFFLLRLFCYSDIDLVQLSHFRWQWLFLFFQINVFNFLYFVHDLWLSISQIIRAFFLRSILYNKNCIPLSLFVFVSGKA